MKSHKIAFGLFMTVLNFSGFAQAAGGEGALAGCRTPTLRDFSAYAIGKMTLGCSDHQGLTGAGGDLTVDHFLFEGHPQVCLALAAGRRLDFQNGNAPPGAEAGQAFLANVFIDGALVSKKKAFLTESTVIGTLLSRTEPQLVRSYVQTIDIDSRHSPRVNHEALATELRDLSDAMAATADNLTLVREGSGRRYLIAKLNAGTNVATVSGSALTKGYGLIVRGQPKGRLVLNVTGRTVTLKNFDVVLENGVRPSAISWNFRSAERLVIRQTADGTHGLPGTVLAPNANVEFNEGLLTGALWVKNLNRGTGCSGQINRP